MKTEFIDVSDTKKDLVVEIPSAVVDSEIERVARDYSKAARIPGFRPGKVPPRLVRQRFREKILHDVAHGLIPRAVDEALRERGVEPVDAPDIRDVVVEEGQPLKFTASFETVPPIGAIDYEAIELRRTEAAVEAGAVDETLERLREQAARYDPVEDRPIETGDTVLVDLQRRRVSDGGEPSGRPEKKEKLESISVDVGSPANPPGFDAELIGLTPGTTKTFTIGYPDEYAIADLAGARIEYEVVVRGIRRRVVPELDDEFAKDLGAFDSLDKLRERVADDLLNEATHAADRQLRADLLRQLAQRASFEVPGALVEREIDRRVEEFIRRLLEQQIDPRRAEINWTEFRERQRDPAVEAVRGALMLDEVARREGLQVSDSDVDEEVARYAARTGRTMSAVRAGLEKEGGLGRLHAGLRREKAVEFLLARAKIITA